MTSPIDTAYVEVVPVLDKFEAELKRRLDAVLGRVGNAVDAATKQIERKFENAADGAGKALDQIARDANTSMDKVSDAADQAGDAVDDMAVQAREALEDVADSARDTGDTLGAQVGEGADNAADAVDDMAEQARRDLAAVDAQIESVERSIRELAREFARTSDQDIFAKIRADKTTLANLRRVREALDEVGDEADKTKRKLNDATDAGSAGMNNLTKIISDAAGVVISLGAALVGLGASAPTPVGIVALTIALTALVAATPLVLGLGAALADLAGLVAVIPAGIGVLAAVLAPLQVAFVGVSDAVSAIIDGDPEKITEALEGMAPAARSVLREFQRLLPVFDDLREAVQQSFFLPLRGALTQVSDTLLPVLQTGMKSVATQLGELTKEIADMARSPQAVEFITNAFATTARIIDRSTEGVQSLIDIFIILGNATLPIVERFVGEILGAAAGFDEFLHSAEGEAALQDLLNDAVATLEDLIGLGKAVFGLFGAIFSTGDEAGRSFIETLTDMTNRLAEFFRSAEGQEFLQNLLDLLPVVVNRIGQFITAVIVVANVINFLVNAGNAIIDWFKAIPDVADGAGSAIGGAFSSAWEAVSEFFSGIGDWLASIPDALAGFASAVGDAFSSALNAVGGFFTGIGQFFAALPGRIAALVGQVGQALVDGFQAAFDAVFFTIGVGIGLILFAILELPGLILQGLQALPGILAAFFTNVWNQVVSITTTAFTAIVTFLASVPGRVNTALATVFDVVSGIFTRTWTTVSTTTTNAVSTVIAFIASIPGKVGSALAALPGIISSAWNKALSSAKSIAVSGFNSIVSFVSSIPGKITAITGRFTSAGKQIMQAVFNGIKAAGGFAGDVGKAIYNVLKSTLNRAIGSINAGIGRVDAALPGSLPRLPYLAQGGIFSEATLAVVGEASSRAFPEVVIPTGDPDRALQLARESGLLDVLTSAAPTRAASATVTTQPSTARPATPSASDLVKAFEVALERVLSRATLRIDDRTGRIVDLYARAG